MPFLLSDFLDGSGFAARRSATSSNSVAVDTNAAFSPSILCLVLRGLTEPRLAAAVIMLLLMS